MGPHQQQQPPQHLNPVVDPAKVIGTAAAPPALMHRSSYSLDDVASTCLAKQASSRRLLNPWRELTPSDFVIGYARGMGRVRCSTCLSKITQGELQVRGKRELATGVQQTDARDVLFLLVRFTPQSCKQPAQFNTRPVHAAAASKNRTDTPTACTRKYTTTFELSLFSRSFFALPIPSDVIFVTLVQKNHIS